MSDEKLADVILRAQEAFWESVAQDYTEAKTGDFQPEIQLDYIDE